MNAPIRIKDPNSSNRPYTFSLGFGGMAALLAALTLSLTLFFALGVLVGRGHRPEAAVPVVAGMMPRETMAQPAPMPEVLKAEELNYSEQLGKKHEGPSPSRPIDKVTEKPAEKKGEKPAEKKDVKKDEKPAAKPGEKIAAKPGEKPAAKPADKKADQKPDPDTQRYEYAYQAASFPEPDQAKAFLKQVKGLGLKADIESGNTNGKAWHRVVVFFQGTPTDTRELKEKLGKIGAPQPLLRSKAAL